MKVLLVVSFFVQAHFQRIPQRPTKGSVREGRISGTLRQVASVLANFLLYDSLYTRLSGAFFDQVNQVKEFHRITPSAPTRAVITKVTMMVIRPPKRAGALY
jgi:hypothetical protein